MSDFAAIVGRRLEDEIQGEPVVDIYLPTGVGVYVLAARWPDGCPTCDGEGVLHEERMHGGGDVAEMIVGNCDHAAAPTLGELLDTAAALHRLAREHGVTPAKLAAIGAAVMGATTATYTMGQAATVEVTTDRTQGARYALNLLGILRAVEP